MKVPSTLEIEIAFEQSLMSCQLGRRTAPSFATQSLFLSWLACSSSSVSAKRPMSTGMNSMPSVKECRPKV